MTEDLSRFCCLNEPCPDHGQRGLGNLTVCHRYGKDGQRRMLYCRSCKYRFSERKGTPLFGSQLTQEKAVSIFEHLAERNGVRATARLVKVNRNTVVRYARLAGEHARQLHDEFVAFSPETREVQLDEKWSFVFKKQAHCDPANPADDNRGDWWDHVAIDAESRLVLAVVPGAQDAESVEELVGEVKDRTGGEVLDLVTSDDYPAYETALLDAYGKASRRINTSFVERQNATDRHHNGRKVRKTYTFSKDRTVHEAMTYFTLYSDNFCWPVRTLREPNGEGRWRPRTPAMAAGLSGHIWTMQEWIKTPGVQQR